MAFYAVNDSGIHYLFCKKCWQNSLKGIVLLMHHHFVYPRGKSLTCVCTENSAEI